MTTNIVTGGDGRETRVQKVADAWERCINPLDGLTQDDIETMFRQARMGNDVMLQLAYAQIEQTMPIFGICMDKRISQVSDMEWEVVDGNGEESPVAQAVMDAMRKCDERQFDSVSQCIEHLMSYSFRGRAAVKPFYDPDGLQLKTLNNWNLLMKNHRLYWNPSSQPMLDDFSRLEEVPLSEVLLCHTDRAIDMPGMLIYLRQQIGETRWSQFVEREGIPQVLITAPEGTPDSALPTWTMRAQQIMNGGSGVLPFGSKVDQLTAARGQDPFSDFCRHQMELIAILATGGSLNTLGGSTGLGSNLADVQNEQFAKLVRKDTRNVERAMTRLVNWVAERIGNKQGIVPGGAGLVFRFKKDEDESERALEFAERIQRLGGTIDLHKLKSYMKVDVMSDVEEGEAWMPSEGESRGE